MDLRALRVQVTLVFALGAGLTFIFMLGNGAKVTIRNGNITPFLGEKAYDHVERLVGLGPRTIGSESLSRARDYIGEYLEGLGIEVVRDDFVASFKGREYAMENIIGVIRGDDQIIALGGHYDTKDIPGANDGGSSAGLLLEMARALSERPQKHTIWLIFFDGEDTGDKEGEMFYGSRHLAAICSNGTKPQWLILVDMIGDRRLGIRRDRNSDPHLTDLVWGTAERLGYGRYFKDSSLAVLDDHVPFMAIGVPSCVLIDFSYGPLNSYWHTQRDSMDKISAKSLKAVGDVVYEAVAELGSGGVG